MTDDPKSQNEEIVDRARTGLERRAAVIRLAMKSGKVGGKELDKLLEGPQWRIKLFEAIERESRPRVKSGLNQVGEELRPFTTIVDKLNTPWNSRQLLTLCILAGFDREKSIALEEEIFRLYGAFGLELLADSKRPARSPRESLLDSLTASGVAVDRLSQFPAFRDLFKRFDTETEQRRRAILRRFMDDVDTIVSLLNEVLSGVSWLRKLRRSLQGIKDKCVEAGEMKELSAKESSAKAEKAKAVTARPVKGQGTKESAHKVASHTRSKTEESVRSKPCLNREHQREPLEWLFDCNLLCQISNAAERANQVGRQWETEPVATGGFRSMDLSAEKTRDVRPEVPPSARSADAMNEDEAAETLVQNQRRMVANVTEFLCQCVHGESLAEELWWRSFDDINGWKSRHVATFCLGRDRALWLTSGSLDIERAQLAYVSSRVDTSSSSVVIFGAGVAGLTAAHELAERGIGVTVVDVARPGRGSPGMASNIGGMARTQWSFASHWPKHSGDAPRSRFPGEHGYRLFPSFYRHLFDTMKRTPLLGVKVDVSWPSQKHSKVGVSVEVSPEQLGIRPTAFDQLQATHQQVFARRGQFVRLRRDKPRSLEAFRTEYMNIHAGLGFPKRDMARFFFKLVRYLMTCSERRADEYESKSLLEFFDPSLYSDGFIDAIKAAPQALVAMDAELCDARTQGNVYIQLLLDQVLGGEYTDSTLRGPTSTAWFSYWYRYLESLDVKFINAELLALRPEDPWKPDSFEVVFKIASSKHDSGLKKKIEAASYIVVALDAVSAERVTRTWESAGVPFELRGFTSHVTEQLGSNLARYDVVITFNSSRPRVDAEDVMHRLLDRIGVAKNDRMTPARERSAFRNLHRATGHVPIPPGDVDEIKLALWFTHVVGRNELREIEKALARLLSSDRGEEVRLLSDTPTWVNSSEKVTTPRMPDDVYGEQATDRFQTFIGVQYYFKHDFKLVQGHMYLPDTEWGLSAVSQGQFWPRRAIPGPTLDPYRGVLSIDVGNCRRKSSYRHRTVMECTREEIALEVWRQFTDSLRSTRGPTSIVTSLPLPEPVAYHVDDNLVFTSGKGSLRANRTPFLVNNAGDWDRRPRCEPWVPGRQVVVDAPRTDATDVWQAPHGGYRVHARKVVFCGTYMRTFTRMTTMEAANESARHAVNAILDHMAAHRKEHDRHPIAGDYCDIWDPEEHELEDLDFFKRIDKQLFEAGKPHIADILQFDKIADLQYPDPSPFQALIAALGSTIKSDWGVTSTELVTSLDGLLRSAKEVVGGVAGATVGDHPLLKLLASLGLGKIKPTQKGS